ncbi:MAG: hypothetical protein ACXVC6_09240 [Bacteroidia bacterium]
MTEQDDIFENLFKESVGEMEMPVSDNLWKRIETTLFGKKKRRFFFWLFLGGIAAIAAVFLYVNSEKNDIASRSEIKQKNISKIERSEEPNEHKEVLPLEKNKVKETSNEKTFADTSIKEKTTDKVATEKKQIKTKSDESYSGAETRDLTEKEKGMIDSSKPSKKSESLSSSKENKRSISEEEKKDQDLAKVSTANKNNTLPETKAQNKPENKVVRSHKTESNEKTTPDKSSSLADTAKKENDATNNGLAETQKTDSSKTEPKDSSLVKKIEKPNNDTIKNPEKEKDKAPDIRMILGLEGGMVSPQIKYTDNNYYGTFKNTSGFDIVSHAGISIKNRLNITFGLGIYTMNTNASLDLTQGTYKDTIKLTKIDSFGNPYFVDSLVTKDKIGRWNGRFHYLYTTIPLTVEYTFSIIKNLRITPGVSVIFNKCLIGPFANTINFSITPDFSLKAGYMINKKWQVYLASHYSYFTKPTYKKYSRDWDWPTILPAYISFNAGLRYYFGK